ncbi:CS1 type fimbrial major subunit [Pseudomonas sp. ES3-33]|uniref:CS1 type fimbrial major subunit n=1 Tax=Pseudomonas sp. ES3-33 TaxID=1628833 RepID=UPI000697C9AA|nr:CS1 type fimbrial major subunit [Pseudomonas sp. ES3-33]
MFRKLAFTLSSVAVLMNSSLAMAATEEAITIQLKANVPGPTFHVRPPASEDWTTVQEIRWDAQRKQLIDWSKNLEVLSTTAGINAKLVSEPELISGSNKIKLDVFVHGTKVKTTSDEVVNAADALAGRQVAFEIKPVPLAGSGRHPEGNYTGTVALIFEPAAVSNP